MSSIIFDIVHGVALSLMAGAVILFLSELVVLCGITHSRS
jgi:hypothetical protein